MVQFIDAPGGFGQQLAKQLGSSAGQGIGNSPQLILDLLKQRREGEAQLGERALALANSGKRKLSPEEDIQILEEQKGKGLMSPLEQEIGLKKSRLKKETERHRLEENINPTRWHHKITDRFTGESDESRSMQGKTLNKQLQNLKGSNELKRSILAGKGMAPEESETAIHGPLSQDILESVNSFPDLKSGRKFQITRKGGSYSGGVTPLKESEKEFFEKHLAETLQKHPDANLLQLREAFENKGIGWQEFGQAIDKLQDEGILDISQNEDWPYMESKLSQPPLGPLKKLLHGFKFIGR